MSYLLDLTLRGYRGAISSPANGDAALSFTADISGTSLSCTANKAASWVLFTNVDGTWTSVDSDGPDTDVTFELDNYDNLDIRIRAAFESEVVYKYFVHVESVFANAKEPPLIKNQTSLTWTWNSPGVVETELVFFATQPSGVTSVTLKKNNWPTGDEDLGTVTPGDTEGVSVPEGTAGYFFLDVDYDSGPNQQTGTLSFSAPAESTFPPQGIPDCTATVTGGTRPGTIDFNLVTNANLATGVSFELSGAASASSTDTSGSFTNLATGTYSVRCQGTNSNGGGTYSSSINDLTISPNPPGSMSSLTVDSWTYSSGNSYNVTLSWSAAASGDVDYYDINSSDVGNVTTTTLVIDANVGVTVTAHNVDGTSSFGPVTFLPEPGPPTSPATQVDADNGDGTFNLTLSWSAPSYGGAVTGYKVDGTDWGASTSLGFTASPGTTYHIVAYNAAGDSSSTDIEFQP